MSELKITECELQGVKIIEPKYFEDFRGYYCETYSSRTMAQYGIDTVFVQDNHILCYKKNIIRGIHFQNSPKAQAKLVRCIKGSIMDYVVDLCKDSPNYKKWFQIELSQKNKRQLFIPKGYGHALLSLEDDTEVIYKVDELFFPEYDRAINWSDPEIAIDWGIDNPILSEKDINAPILAMSDVNFVMENTLI